MQINRRDFLKMAGLGLGTMAVQSCGPLNKLANKLSDEVSKVSWEDTPIINSLEQASDRINESLSSFSGIDNGQVIITDGTKANLIQFGNNEESIYPESTIKIAICNEVWKRYPNLLTPEIAEKILGNSQSTIDLLMSTPLAVDKSQEDRETIIRELLNGTGAGLTSPEGEMSLQVNFANYFKYLNDSEFPDVILKAMRLNSSDNEIYDVQKVLANYLDLDQTPVYFKLGMNMMGENETTPMALSYYFRTEGMQIYGYLFGSGCENMTEQMRSVAAVVGSFVNSKLHSPSPEN